MVLAAIGGIEMDVRRSFAATGQPQLAEVTG
jgi:hypothetical protein